MKLSPALLLLTTLFQATIAEFDCDEETKPDKTCQLELNCNYNDDFREEDDDARGCRCRTVIFDDIPGQYLSLTQFQKICAKFPDDLRQLWVPGTSLRSIDNAIFTAYKNLDDVNLAGNKLLLNFSQAAGRLKRLDLSQNGIAHLESRHFHNLVSVQFLNISHNKLEEVNYCFKNIENLEEIYLNNNGLKIIKKDDFFHLKKLKIINLAHNLLTVIHSNLFDIDIQELYLNDNNLKSIDYNNDETYSADHSKLITLDIGRNRFKSIRNMLRLYHFDKLKTLNCDNNNLKSLESKVFEKLVNLKVLNLSNNQLQTMKENLFANSARLAVLDISSNALNSIPQQIFQTQLQDLKVLKLQNNSLDEKLINYDNLQYLRDLNNLELSFNQIAVVHNTTFAQLHQLESLNLMANNLKVIADNAFDSLTKLKHLNLAQNQIMDLPKHLFDNTKQLESLNVADNKMDSFDLDLLKNTQNLQALDVKGNQIKSFDFEKLKLVVKSLKSIAVDEESIDCTNPGNVLDYFIENDLLKRCQGGNCCGSSKMPRSINQIVIYTGIAGGVLVFAVIGLVLVLKQFCCPLQKPAFQMVHVPSPK